LSNFKIANCLATEKIPFKAQAPVIAFFSKGARTFKDRLFFVLKQKKVAQRR
jgi:hypothetical protein